jgi:hypothetical protein
LGGAFEDNVWNPGIGSSVLCYDPNAAARKVGVAAGGGGGGGAAWYFDPPKIADLPLTIGSPLTLSDDADVGLLISAAGAFSDHWAIGQALPTTTDWTVTMRYDFREINDHYCNLGLSVWEPVSGKNFLYGVDSRQGNPLMHLYRANPGGYDGFEIFQGMSGAAPNWIQMRYTHATGDLECYWSAEGKVWVLSLGHNILADFGGNQPYACGPVICAGSYPYTAAMSVQYLTYT